MEFVCARRELAAMRDFWLEIFSHHRKKTPKPQNPKTPWANILFWLWVDAYK